MTVYPSAFCIVGIQVDFQQNFSEIRPRRCSRIHMRSSLEQT
ncbi:hypothetical protein HMPREF0239_00282 [Clostridium sp. ATCC BAA-442]|nr:hypothetical protein HMPREF0239_00282 [Clostridium sp. ATCC BAA-442]DAZ70655.1 MAG TPA: hypothetical protein [Caudoviricetes sp.]